MTGKLAWDAFAVQVALTATVVALSVVQLARGEPAQVWLPVLTSLTGYWLPAPRRTAPAPPLAPPPQEAAAAASGPGSGGDLSRS